MEKVLKYISLSLLFFCFFACDYIEKPLADIQNGGNNPQDSIIRKLLIEDFTGHTCGNCPAAAKTAQQLQELYGKKIIIVGIHSGYFAEPDLSGSKYTTDYRTAAGEAYNELWKNDVAGNPNGFVSRSKIINNNIIIQPGSWGEAVELLKNNLPDISIDLNIVYDGNTRSLKATVKSKAINTLSEKHDLVLYLVEDKITDWQKDYSITSGDQDVENFIHKHVLRDNINGTWGEELFSSSFAAGDSIVKTYNNYLINPSWKAEDCSVIAYIYNTNTYEIIQAEEVHITP